MNKLRITPKSNLPQKNEKIENSFNKPISNTEFESINYFLSKNTVDFTIEDINKFKNLVAKYTKDFYEKNLKINEKLSSLSINLISKKNTVVETDNQAIIDFEIINKIPNNFISLKPLIQEIIDDNTCNGKAFINDLINSLSKINDELSNYNNVENLYRLLSEMLIKLQSYDISQQKYIYRAIANVINLKISNYYLVSPEDGNFVDPKLHKIISGLGQRIVRGLSYILIAKNSDEVLKFGNVKTI